MAKPNEIKKRDNHRISKEKEPESKRSKYKKKNSSYHQTTINDCIPFMPHLNYAQNCIKLKPKSTLVFGNHNIKSESQPEFSERSSTTKDLVQIIGDYLEENIGHQKQFLIAGSYPSSIAANEEYRTLSLKYNDIDVYIKYNGKDVKTDYDVKSNSIYDDETVLQNITEVNYTNVPGISVPIIVLCPWVLGTNSNSPCLSDRFGMVDENGCHL